MEIQLVAKLRTLSTQDTKASVDMHVTQKTLIPHISDASPSVLQTMTETMQKFEGELNRLKQHITSPPR